MMSKNYQNLLHKDLSYQIQGVAIDIRKNLGPGFKEVVYQNVFAEDRKHNKLSTVLSLVLFSVFISLFSVSAVRGAEMYFGTSAGGQALGSTFAVGVFIDTQGEIINAVEGNIYLPSNLELQDFLDGNSVINFWVEKPQKECMDKCYIKFSGVTPGGFFGDSELLFSFVLQAGQIGEAEISIGEARVLLHDGAGTETFLKKSPITLKILETGEAEEFVLPFDSESPESFVPIIDKNPDILDNNFFVVFATQDKVSGIDHYELAEKRGAEVRDYENLDWQIAQSPYLLQDQKLFSFIYIKAVDKAGNQRIQIVPPTYQINLLQKYWFYGIILLIVLFIYILRRILWRKKQSQN